MEIAIPSVALWILFWILVIMFIVFGIVFSYHWNHYGVHATSKKVAKVSYFFISLLILGAIAFFIGVYTM